MKQKNYQTKTLRNRNIEKKFLTILNLILHKWWRIKFFYVHKFLLTITILIRFMHLVRCSIVESQFSLAFHCKNVYSIKRSAHSQLRVNRNGAYIHDWAACLG